MASTTTGTTDPDPHSNATLTTPVTLGDIPMCGASPPAGAADAAAIVARIRANEPVTAAEIAALHLQEVGRAAELLRVSGGTVRNMVNRGELDAFRSGRRILVPLASITTYLARTYTPARSGTAAPAAA
ncbi:hypothetical protein GCM10010466_39510 [Planomonospora alba]|uniref:Helix-turn-helix domain-containing protein n=1 Tax=Planomonospora alba TaxID=161354 RepID=A0ABP6NI73_9ACTN